MAHSCTQGRAKALEIERGGRQGGLDLHIVEAVPHGAPKSMPGFRLAVEPLRTPAVTSGQSPVLFAPPRRVVVADHHRLVDVPVR